MPPPGPHNAAQFSITTFMSVKFPLPAASQLIHPPTLLEKPPWLFAGLLLFLPFRSVRFDIDKSKTYVPPLGLNDPNCPGLIVKITSLFLPSIMTASGVLPTMDTGPSISRCVRAFPLLSKVPACHVRL